MEEAYPIVEDIGPDIQADEIFVIYLGTSGQWGNEIMITAMATLTRTNIAVYTNDTSRGTPGNSNWRWRVISPLYGMRATNSALDDKTIFIRLKNSHYQIVKW